MNVWIVALTWLFCGISKTSGQHKCPLLVPSSSNSSGAIEYNSTVNGGECIWEIPAPKETDVVVRVIEINFRQGRDCLGILYMPSKPENKEDDPYCAKAPNFCWVYHRSSTTCSNAVLQRCGHRERIELALESRSLLIRAENRVNKEVSLTLHYDKFRCPNQPAQEAPESNSHPLPDLPLFEGLLRPAATSTTKRYSTVKSTKTVPTTDSLQLTTSMEPQATKIELATNGTTNIEQNDTPTASATLPGSGTVETRKRSRDTRSRDTGSNVAYIVVIALLGVLLVAALIAIIILGLKLRRVKATATESASNGVHPMAAEEANGKIEATAMAELVESVAYGARGGEEVNAYATVQ